MSSEKMSVMVDPSVGGPPATVPTIRAMDKLCERLDSQAATIAGLVRQVEEIERRVRGGHRWSRKPGNKNWWCDLCGINGGTDDAPVGWVDAALCKGHKQDQDQIPPPPAQAGSVGKPAPAMPTREKLAGAARHAMSTHGYFAGEFIHDAIADAILALLGQSGGTT